MNKYMITNEEIVPNRGEFNLVFRTLLLEEWQYLPIVGVGIPPPKVSLVVYPSMRVLRIDQGTMVGVFSKCGPNIYCGEKTRYMLLLRVRVASRSLLRMRVSLYEPPLVWIDLTSQESGSSTGVDGWQITSRLNAFFDGLCIVCDVHSCYCSTL